MTTPHLIELCIASALLVGAYYAALVLLNENSIRRVSRLAEAGQYKEAVDRLYSMIWTGLPEDEAPAWDRVIAYIEENGYCREMKTEAELRWLARLYYGHNVRYSDKTEVLA